MVKDPLTDAAQRKAHPRRMTTMPGNYEVTPFIAGCLDYLVSGAPYSCIALDLFSDGAAGRFDGSDSLCEYFR
jgi:hypothetical protein